jgi:hypothetical protein
LKDLFDLVEDTGLTPNNKGHETKNSRFDINACWSFDPINIFW